MPEHTRILILDCDAPHGRDAAAVKEILESASGLPPVFTTVTISTEEAVRKTASAGREGDFEALIAVCRAGGGPADALDTLLPLAKIPVLALVGVTSHLDAIELLRRGAADVIMAPPTAADLIPRLWRLLERSGRDALTHRFKQELGLSRLVGEAPRFLLEVRKVPLAARCDVTVLITGETGTGKELFARAVHYLSPRVSGPFNPVNCGAIPPELVENELFGHRSGAFTGATSDRPGLIEDSEGGTMFLDEIDCLPRAAQVKLLRFLQEKEYRPLGSTRMRSADVRVISAMSTLPEEALASGRLRQDLYYRLNVFPLGLPALRERPEDIPLLARHFLDQYSAEYCRMVSGYSPEALATLAGYHWPGNVRELEHVVQRAVVLSSGARIENSDILITGARTEPRPLSFREQKARIVAQFEADYLQRLLAACGGNISQAARAAQKNRRAFFELLRKHRIEIDRFRRKLA